MINNKRGDLTSMQIILLVLSIAGFVIVMIFFFAFRDIGITEDELCKLSVLTRATTPQEAQAIIPIKCTTKKVCLTDMDSNCELNFAGEKDVRVVKLSGTPEEKARIIEIASVESMYTCWDNMGQGKLDLFWNYAKLRNLESTKVSCVICSRLAVDLKESDNVFPKVDVYRYMEQTQVPGSSLTYLQVFSDRQFSTYPKASQDAFTNYIKDEKNIDTTAKIDIQGVKNYEVAVLFSQIKTQDLSEVLTSLGKDAVLLGAGAFLPPGIKQATAFTLKLIPTQAKVALGVILVAGVGATATINYYLNIDAAAGYCGEFASGDKANKGCSLVQIVPYTFKNVNALCDDIQGNP